MAQLKAAVESLPAAVPGAQGVFFCGYNSEQSFAGSAWLVTRPAGNVLVDSPRFDPKLVKRVRVRQRAGPPALHRACCFLLDRACQNAMHWEAIKGPRKHACQNGWAGSNCKYPAGT
jgi:hypothetical protein